MLKICFQTKFYSFFALSRAGPAPVAQARSSSAFTGGGHTLGSDDVESSYIPGLNSGEGAQGMKTISANRFYPSH